MKHISGIALALLMISPAIAADPTPPPAPPTHDLKINDVELQLISFLMTHAGSHCDMTPDGKQYCLAAMESADMLADFQKQLAAEVKK